MIMIRVVSFNGQPLAQPIGFEFDELGGTIGRSETNQLVLPDPERHVSRLQARIVWRSGGFEIVNVGANALEVGAKSVANGSAATIRPGDLITIGGYVLEVAGAAMAEGTAPTGAGAAPVDDPLGLFGAGEKVAAREDPFAGMPAGAREVTPAPSRPPARPIDDPFAAFSESSAKTGAEASGTRRAASPAAAAPPARSGALIPDDFDPFADPFAPPKVEPPAPASTALDDLGFGPTGESVSGPGIDTMFGLGAAAPSVGRDPLAGSALGAPPPGEEKAGQVVEPLAALAGTPLPAAKAAPVPDQVPELRGAYRPPAPVVPDDAFLSWEQGPADRGREAPAPEPEESAPVRPRVDVEVSFGAPPKAAAGQLRADAAVSPAAVAPQPPADVATSGAVETAAVALGEDATALLHAFLKGLGMPDLALPHGLTPEAMETIGRLLREATAGTLALLLARAVTKREVRAEVTMIVSRDNNPLKFSPDVEAALAHLLAPRGKGFLPPVEAMRDAYDDLRSHELGFMAGMRAALAGVLHRFDPAVLEQRLSGKSMLDSLLPMNRRARLWDLYTELFREIASEAEDDFHALFGREFLRAYEEQVERVKERDA